VKASRWLGQAIGSGMAAKAALSSLVLGAAAFAGAQTGAMSPNQGESDGVSAGGKWLEFASTDKMTGANKVRFELQSDNYFKEDSGYRPRVNLYCSNGKLKLADFNPGVRLLPPNRPGFWGQPQLEVEVRVDGVHYFKGWNWLRGHYLSMDKGTARLDERPGFQHRAAHEKRPADRGVHTRRPEFRSRQTSLRPDAEKAEQRLEAAAVTARREMGGVCGFDPWVNRKKSAP